ncbi:MAG: flagellar type III secretion system protein FlhB [Betaproteobacteria bacterium]|nr:flagellar type III secretion system protein FlhB [Betaproteobacteria bacterium]
MAEDSDLEKTEQPSQRRLDQAREEGQVARSRELSTFAVLMAGGAGVWLMGAHLSHSLLHLLQEGLTWDASVAFQSDLLLPRLYRLTSETLLAFMPLLLLLLVAAVFSPLLLNGWMFSFKAMQPNLERLDPIAGLKRLFSMHGWVELAKSIAKALVVGTAGAWAIWHHKEAMLGLAGQPVNVAAARMGELLWDGFFAIMGGMLLIVAVDVPFQLWEHAKRLRMTREEVRQESKETEGDPQVRGRIRSMQREMARRRMMSKVQTADVVVTNPTHYAVALCYREQSMRAPIVVAKGSHLLAARIRELAEEHRIPILEAPPLARALYKHGDLERTIPEQLYIAVAEVLAYAYQLRRYEVSGGTHPVVPRDLDVPPELDPETSLH